MGYLWRTVATVSARCWSETIASRVNPGAIPRCLKALNALLSETFTTSKPSLQQSASSACRPCALYLVQVQDLLATVCHRPDLIADLPKQDLDAPNSNLAKVGATYAWSFPQDSIHLSHTTFTHSHSSRKQATRKRGGAWWPIAGVEPKKKEKKNKASS